MIDDKDDVVELRLLVDIYHPHSQFTLSFSFGVTIVPQGNRNLIS